MRPAERLAPRLEAPTLGLLCGWVAVVSWSGMVSRPGGYLMPALAIGAVVVLAGAGLRMVDRPRFPPYAVAGSQVLLAALGLNLVTAHERSWLGFVPTRSSVLEVGHALVNGGATLNHFSAPVSANPDHTRAVLTACAVGILLVIELLLTWARQPSLVALPLLAALSVPVSILQESLALPVFVGTALLFIRLLGAGEADGSSDRNGTDGPPRRATSVLWQVGAAAVLLALLAAPLVPVTNLLDRGRAAAEGTGAGAGNFEFTTVDPFVRLRRDLVEQTNTPMVYVETQAPRTSYVRTTVLDEFTKDGWKASPRQLPEENDANGRFPPVPGLGPGVEGRNDTWRLELAPAFLTTWLPLPYPLRSLEVPGSWRYDDRTLDVALVGAAATSGLTYSAVAFTPELNARVLQSSISAPSRVQVPNTQVPEDLPPIVEERARAITRGTSNNFERAVALQEWFRSGGGFTYSLEQRAGSGMDLLEHFLTDDRVGYCEQFAAAMAAMGRTLGIPSRVVVGFLDGTSQPDGRVLYTSDDRHAWPEMYFSGVGWVRFEPTPGQRAGATPPWTRQDAQRPDPAQAPAAPLTRAPVPVPGDQARAAAEANGLGLAWRPLLGVGLFGLALAVPSTARRLQRRRRLGGGDRLELVEGAWSELRASALDHGLRWPEQRSPREQATAVSRQVLAGGTQVRTHDRLYDQLDDLRADVERGRYARTGAGSLTEEDRSRTVGAVRAWRRAMEKHAGWSWRSGWRSRLWPASWWEEYALFGTGLRRTRLFRTGLFRTGLRRGRQ